MSEWVLKRLTNVWQLNDYDNLDMRIIVSDDDELVTILSNSISRRFTVKGIELLINSLQEAKSKLLINNENEGDNG